MFRRASSTRVFRAAVAAVGPLLAATAACAHAGPPEPAAMAQAPEARRESRPLGPSHAPSEAASPSASSANGSGWILRTGLSLGGVIALIMVSGGITRVMARGRGGLAGPFGPGGRAPSGVISVLGRYPVSRGQKLVLLHIDRRILLVSQAAGGRLGAGGGMSTLCEITDPEEVASILIKSRDAEADSMAERFRSMLGAVDRAFRPQADAPDREMRRVFAGVSGDRAEVWDDQALGAPAEPEPRAFPIRQPGPLEHDAVGSLRRRLAALRSDDGQEAAA